MKNKWIMPLAFVCGILIGGACFYAGFSKLYVAPPELETPEDMLANTSQTEPKEEDVPTVNVNRQTIKPSTLMVYQYYYEEDGSIVEQEGEPSYFLLDLDREALADYYAGWDILSFSDQKVVMRRTIVDDSRQTYIIGTYEGRIAVFYEEEKQGSSLYELTDIATDALSQEEKVRLNDGIFVTGEEALAKVLEDYGS